MGPFGQWRIKGINVRNTSRFCAAMLLLALSMFLFVKAARYFAPLIVAMIISLALEPVVKKLIKHVRLKRAFAGPAVIIALLASVFLLLWAAVARLAREFIALLGRAPEYIDALGRNLDAFIDSNGDLLSFLPTGLDMRFEALVAELSEWASENATGVAATAMKNAFETAAGLPFVLLFMLTAMISTFFIIMEREKHAEFIRRNIPDKWIKAAIRAKNIMFNALFGYIRAQLVIMGVMFAILFTGFMIAGVPYALFVAFLSALLDALPILGIGIVLIPWAIYSFIAGNIFLGATLAVLFAVCSLARRLIEPKILSQQVGADPLMTVTSMFLGFRLFGMVGVATGPIAYILIRIAALGMLGGKSFREYFLLEPELQEPV